MTIQPKTRKELENIIQNEIELHGDECNLNHIDTSLIIDMSSLFFNSSFNGDISNWDVSNVIGMNYMFHDSQFNRDISQWNVSNVVNMVWMFCSSQFNKDISQWDVSKVKNMEDMFYNSLFDGDLSNWKPIKLRDIDSMFYNSKCIIPYWYFEDSKEIPEKVKQYQEAKVLSEKLANELVIQKLNNNKIKI